MVCREIAGEYILVPVSGQLANMQAIFALNPVGRCIWENLDERKTVEEVRRAVVERFDVTEEAAGRDVDEFLAELLFEDLVSVGG